MAPWFDDVTHYYPAAVGPGDGNNHELQIRPICSRSAMYYRNISARGWLETLVQQVLYQINDAGISSSTSIDYEKKEKSVYPYLFLAISFVLSSPGFPRCEISAAAMAGFSAGRPDAVTSGH